MRLVQTADKQKRVSASFNETTGDKIDESDCLVNDFAIIRFYFWPEDVCFYAEGYGFDFFRVQFSDFG